MSRYVVLEQGLLRFDHLLIVITNSFISLEGFLYSSGLKKAKKRNLIDQY